MGPSGASEGASPAAGPISAGPTAPRSDERGMPGPTVWSAETFDPRDPAFAADPYPLYARLRAAGAVHFIEATGDWWAVRHREAGQVLSDARFVKGRGQPPEVPPAFAHLPPLQPSMLMRDPPDHTRLRTLVNRAFTPGVVGNLAPHIQTIADELIDGLARRERADLVADFAFPLPATVIAEMLGVPLEDRERFKAWSQQIIRLLDGTQAEDVRRAGWLAQLELLDYFHHLVARRRNDPRDDLIGALLAAGEQGDRLGAGEVLTMCSLLLIAGHETTTNVIGTGTLVLLQHPDQLAIARGHPEQMPAVVEELLRFVSPVQLDGRVAAEDLELGGQHIRAGQWVLAVIGSANRDEGVWRDAGTLDVTRSPNPHLAFGRGIHFCLGAPLARLEARIALQTLLRRLPRLTVDTRSPATWNRNLVIRGLSTLPVLPTGGSADALVAGRLSRMG